VKIYLHNTNNYNEPSNWCKPTKMVYIMEPYNKKKEQHQNFSIFHHALWASSTGRVSFRMNLPFMEDPNMKRKGPSLLWGYCPSTIALSWALKRKRSLKNVHYLTSKKLFQFWFLTLLWKKLLKFWNFPKALSWTLKPRKSLKMFLALYKSPILLAQHLKEGL